MFGHKVKNKNRSDIYVYTAKKLQDMAESMEILAKSCADDIKEEQGLTRDDGLLAMQTAATLVCSECSRCSIYEEAKKDESYYPYYLIRTFEQNGQVRTPDLPQIFSDKCLRKDSYIKQINLCLGKAKMNLSWKNRFLESRDAVMLQFGEIASILDEFAYQMSKAVDITDKYKSVIKKEFRKNHVQIEQMMLLEYNNHKEIYMTVKTDNGSCIISKEASGWLEKIPGFGKWIPTDDCRMVIGRQYSVIHMTERGEYRVMYGIAKMKKDGETLSGDNYEFSCHEPGEAMLCLSDGMGSGEKAWNDSKKVIELTEQLLATNFSSRSTLKLVNTILLLTGKEQCPATLDLCCIDLYSGVMEAMKLGAAPTYIINENGVEILEAADTPAGIIEQVEPVLLSKKLWSDDRIIMISDGILDAMPGNEKEAVLREFIETLPKKAPQEMAERILKFAYSGSPAVRDDMTVLTAGIWKRG